MIKEEKMRKKGDKSVETQSVEQRTRQTVQDFDLPMGLVVMPMFLFSGTFFPISLYPQAIQLAIEETKAFESRRFTVRVR